MQDSVSEKESRFWNRMAERYARQPIADEAAYRTKLEITRGHFTPESEVLEFGCGTGGTAILHAPFVRHIEAMDFSERMLDIARQRAREAGVHNLTFVRRDIETEALPAARYDVVLGLSILHLLNNRRAAIEKVFGALKPGGVFISSTACVGDTGKFLKVVAPIGKALGLLPQLDVMTSADLARSITDAGFAIEHSWQPGKGKAMFIVARKPGTLGGRERHEPPHPTLSPEGRGIPD